MRKAAFIINYGHPSELGFLFTDGTYRKADINSSDSKDLFLLETKVSVDSILNDLSVKILTLGNGDASNIVNASDFKCECKGEKSKEQEPNFDIEPLDHWIECPRCCKTIKSKSVCECSEISLFQRLFK